MKVGDSAPCPVCNEFELDSALVEETADYKVIVWCRLCFRHYEVTTGPGIFDYRVAIVVRPHVCIAGPVPSE